MSTANQVTWFEVLGNNPDNLRGFYGKLFGWKYNLPKQPGMDYGMTEAAQTGIGGGIGKAEQGPGWAIFYVSVPDVAATLARVEQLGGKVLVPVTTLPEVTFAVFADPEGHPIGLAKM